MKILLLKDKKGRAIASINYSLEDSKLVPLDVDSDEGGTLEELEVRPRDLLDLDKFYDKVHRK